MKSTRRAPIETGTQNKDGVDYNWLPPGTVPTPSEWFVTCICIWLFSVGVVHILFCCFAEKSPAHKSPRNRKNKTESSS